MAKKNNKDYSVEVAFGIKKQPGANTIYVRSMDKNELKWFLQTFDTINKNDLVVTNTSNISFRDKLNITKEEVNGLLSAFNGQPYITASEEMDRFITDISVDNISVYSKKDGVVKDNVNLAIELYCDEPDASNPAL